MIIFINENFQSNFQYFTLVVYNREKIDKNNEKSKLKC